MSSLIPFFHIGFFSINGAVDEYFPMNKLLILIFYVGGVFVYIKRFPENILPGRFCFFGNSHQIWHVMVVLGIVFTYYASLDAYNSRLIVPFCM